MSKAARAARHRRADAAEPDDAERRAGRPRGRGTALPTTACPSRPRARCASPSTMRRRVGEHQREREVGGRRVEHARRVRHRDAARAARVDVDAGRSRRRSSRRAAAPAAGRARRRRSARPATISTSTSSRLVERADLDVGELVPRGPGQPLRRERRFTARERSPSTSSSPRVFSTSAAVAQPRRAVATRELHVPEPAHGVRIGRAHDRHAGLDRLAAPPRRAGRAGRAARSSRSRRLPRARPRCTRSSCERVRRPVVDDPPLRVAEAAHGRMPHRLDDLPRQPVARPRAGRRGARAAPSRARRARRRAGRACRRCGCRTPSPRSTRNGASALVRRGDLLGLAAQRVGVEARHDAHVRRVVADREVLVAEVARRDRHLLDRSPSRPTTSCGSAGRRGSRRARRARGGSRVERRLAQLRRAPRQAEPRVELLLGRRVGQRPSDATYAGEPVARSELACRTLRRRRRRARPGCPRP